MRAKPKTAIDQIKKIECRPKKKITISGRVPKKIGGVVMIEGKEAVGKSLVKEALIPKKIKKKNKINL